MNDVQARLTEAKERLSAAAARCLTGDRQAAADADAAMAEVQRLLAEQAEGGGSSIPAGFDYQAGELAA